MSAKALILIAGMLGAVSTADAQAQVAAQPAPESASGAPGKKRVIAQIRAYDYCLEDATVEPFGNEDIEGVNFNDWSQAFDDALLFRDAPLPKVPLGESGFSLRLIADAKTGEVVYPDLRGRGCENRARRAAPAHDPIDLRAGRP